MKIIRNLKYIFPLGLILVACVREEPVNPTPSAQNLASLKHYANKLSLPEDWMSIQNYIYCDLFREGKTIQQVERELGQIENYVTHDGPPQDIYKTDKDAFARDYALRETQLWLKTRNPYITYKNGSVVLVGVAVNKAPPIEGKIYTIKCPITESQWQEIVRWRD